MEICGGVLTDAGVKNIKELSSLVCLNLSQNSNLTDKTLELISGTSADLCFSVLFFFLRSTWSHFVCFVLSPLDQVENLNGHMKIYKRNSVGIAPSSFTVNVVLGLLGGLHF